MGNNISATTGISGTNGIKGKLPLHGIRVANFGWGWMGPVVGQTLAFLGAEVYKVESRARVDLNRTIPPFGGGIRDPNRSLQNHACCAGNGSISINLKIPEGQELARRFVAHCDVANENFGTGVIDKLGLGYEALRAVKPDLVMVSMPAAGLTGPLKNVRTYGQSLAAVAGLEAITGYVGGPPIPFENAYADPLSGIGGAFAILLGLHYRKRTGKGQYVDYAQLEAILQMVGPAFMDYMLNGRVAGPIGNRHPTSSGAPHGVFPCAGDDRWISIAVMNDEEWLNLCRAMGASDWAQNSELSGLHGRLANIDALHERIAAWTRQHDDYALAQLLQEQGVAAAPVLNVGDLLKDPQYRSRGTFIEVTHPLGFKETIYGSYVKMSRSKVDVRTGPMIGRDNEHVFLGLMGMSESEYQSLIAAQVIY